MARTIAASSSKAYKRTGAWVSTHPFTFHCWAKPNAVASGLFLMVMDDSGSGASQYIAMAIGSSNKLYATFTGFASGTTSSGSLSNGSWFSCGMTITNAASQAVFLNGTKTSGTVAGFPTTGNDVSALGYLPLSAANFFEGDMGDAAIWNVVLDDAEMNALSKGFSPLMIRPQSLVAYYPLDGSGAGNELDRWNGRKDVAIVSGTPADADSYPLIQPDSGVVLLSRG